MCDDMEKITHQFVVFWCCEGLEFVGDVTQDRKDAMVSKLRGQKHISNIPNLMHLELRARYNPQRFYELWVVDAASGITKEDIQELFQSNPQIAADLIRSKGTRIFGSSMSKQKSIIV